MTTFKVVQVRRNQVLEWTVERSPRGGAYDLHGFYLLKAEADAEADRLTRIEIQATSSTTLLSRQIAAHSQFHHSVGLTRS
jgi:hypothetical protein